MSKYLLDLSLEMLSVCSKIHNFYTWKMIFVRRKNYTTSYVNIRRSCHMKKCMENVCVSQCRMLIIRMHVNVKSNLIGKKYNLY